MNHNFVKTDSGFQCTVCLWTFKSRPHAGDCPGVPHYKYFQAPANLMTIAQLKKMHLKPGSERRGVVRSQYGEYDLFDQAEATPYTPEEIAAEKEGQRRYRLGLKTRRERWQKQEAERQAAFDKMITDARDSAILWARGLLANPGDWVILDTETTGLDSGDEIIQIAILNPEGEVLLDELVKPSIEISAEAESVNGISAAMLADKPGFAAISLQVFELLESKKIVTYNADFDRRMLYQTCSRHNTGRDVAALDWSDAMIAYSRFYGEWSDYWHDFKWQSLWGGDHTAAGDCRATLERIRRMAAAELSSEKKPESAA